MDGFFRFWGSKKREVGVPSSTVVSSEPAATAGNWEANVVAPVGRRSLLVPAWCRGVSLIMQTMGQMQVQWQRMNGEGGNFIEDRYGFGRKINYLLQVRPNPLMTASEMQEQIEYRKIYWGNAFVYIERDRYGDPEYLWLCTSGAYDPIMDSYILVYNGQYGPNVKVSVPSGDVLHFKNVFLTEDMYMGIPMIWVAMNALSIAATGNEQSLQDMAKGGKMKLILGEETNGNITPIAKGLYNKEAMDRYAREIQEKMYTSDVVALRGLDKIQVVSQTSQQLQLLESRGFEVAEIARILGIPRIMMMEDGGNYKMPEHATQEFLLRTIQPRIRKHEDELNSKLLKPEDFGKRRIHVCELALRRLDAKGQAEIDKLHLETGWSVNELRSQYDLPNIPDGDKHYVSTNLAEVGSEKLRSAGGQSAPVESKPDDELETSNDNN